MGAPITKPMLAGKCENVDRLKLPLLSTPKLDGIRCMKVNGKALTRTFKPIPNKFIREYIEANCPDGVDGEILVADRTFSELSGDVRRSTGTPDFTYFIFDYVKYDLQRQYFYRMADLSELELPERCSKLLPIKINTQHELGKYERDCLRKNFEGIMVRTYESPYKCGRSSMREGYLLKIKRFEDAEGTVLFCMEQMHNDNPATRDNFGRTERSSHRANLRPAGVLGALIVKPLSAGPITVGDTEWVKANAHRLEAAVRQHPVFFGLGTGYSATERAMYWDKRAKLIGKIVTYKFQPAGADAKPRFPVWKGFREAFDISK